ncbi:MAG: hypothetical protein JNM38_20690 [Acidobacteria bacterium]|nr:hypothetical protein [Acidobacteriota bacterium]
MRIRALGFGLAFATALSLMPSVAYADNTTCANADFLFPGIGRGQTVSNATTRYYKARVVAGRSYSVYSWAPYQDAGEGGASIDHAFYTNSTCSTAAGTTDTSANEPWAVVTSMSGDNDTIIPTFTGTMWISVSNSDATGYTVFTAVQETTIFSPWWYAAGNYNAFAEIKNATDTSLTYTLTAYGPNGTVCGTSSGSLSANGNIGINIRNLGTCQVVGSGSAQVAFQGPPGAVVGNITTLDGTLGISFDSPFTPRMPWAISTQ